MKDEMGETDRVVAGVDGHETEHPQLLVAQALERLLGYSLGHI
jgi:hypothetical protein